MRIVDDASLAGARPLPDDRTTALMDVPRRFSSERASMPTIFRHGTRNTLLVSERRGRVGGREVDDVLGGLDRTSLEERSPGDVDRGMTLTRAHGPTASDAACASLALSTGSGLATLEGALARASRPPGIDVLGPLVP